MAGFTIKPTRQLLQERGLLEGGKVQKFIDSECIRHMDKYTPMQTGFLKRSVILGSVIGSGILRYIASCSRSVYYNNAGRGVEGTANGGKRGRKWFEVMKTFHLSEIVEGAKKIAMLILLLIVVQVNPKNLVLILIHKVMLLRKLAGYTGRAHI